MVDRGTFDECRFQNLSQESQDIAADIASLFLKMFKDITKGISPAICRPNFIIADGTERRHQDVDMSEKNRVQFIAVVSMLREIYLNLLRKQQCTKRDLYYKFVEIVDNQTKSDKVIEYICGLLKRSRKCLNINATGKGLVAGDLSWEVSGETVEVGYTGDQLIPANIAEYNLSTKKAEFVLLVEKDAVFQQLLKEDVFEILEPHILITGKGYADQATCCLLNVLSTRLNLPVFALMDCDPYGIEIAAVVKWGSVRATTSKCVDKPARTTSSIILLGLLPSDIPKLQLTNDLVKLTDTDIKKLDSLKNRLTRLGDDEATDWLKQVSTIESSGYKAELEALSKHPKLTVQYLKDKLQLFKEESKMQQLLSDTH